MNKLFISIVLLFTIFQSCKQSFGEDKTAIVLEEDYAPILEKLNPYSISPAVLDHQISFWLEKSSKTKGAYLYHEKLGDLYVKKFELTGDIENIVSSNHHYHFAANATEGNYKANLLLLQSSNYIKLHQFGKAREKCLAAFPLSKDSFGVSMMLFDALMELGEYQEAGEIMDVYDGSMSFDYLVRYGKYMDHKGDLETAIESTELALDQLTSVEIEKINWVTTHLGDMYGHRGDIRKSYETFLAVLNSDPHNLHALRGLAWIAFSHDNNYQVAQQILESITKSTVLPDAHLMLAEIAEAQLKLEQKEVHIKKYISIIQDEELEHLYSDYLTDLYLEKDPVKSLSLARLGCAQRKTPKNYVSLAKAFQKNNQDEAAKTIIEKQIIGKTFEPSIIYESGKILMKMGETEMGKRLLSEVSEASFELGPVIHKDIEQLLG